MPLVKVQVTRVEGARSKPSLWELGPLRRAVRPSVGAYQELLWGSVLPTLPFSPHTSPLTKRYLDLYTQNWPVLRKMVGLKSG